MRPSGLTSTGPKAAKSMSGTRGSAAPAESARGGPVSAFLTNALTSSSLMRPLSPLPVTRARSTPSSRAKRRSAGLACALRMSGSALPAGAAIGAVMRTVESCTGALADAGSAGAGTAGFATGVAAASPFTVATTSPAFTRPPRVTWSFVTVPAADDGTSIVALSVSSDTRGDSTATVSPSFTRTSMTSTSLNSPRSGTRTSIAAGAAADAGFEADADFAAGADTGAEAGFGAEAACEPSTTATGEPFDTRSPFFTATSATRPAAVEGTSIVALSVSSVMSGASTSTVSPDLTSTSMTSTSLNSPRSGTTTVVRPAT